MVVASSAGTAAAAAPAAGTELDKKLAPLFKAARGKVLDAAGVTRSGDALYAAIDKRVEDVAKASAEASGSSWRELKPKLLAALQSSSDEVLDAVAAHINWRKQVGGACQLTWRMGSLLTLSLVSEWQRHICSA